MTHHPASHRCRRRAAAVVAAVVCCCTAAAGCSRSADRPAPVSGQVLVKGQPAKGVTVMLHPVAAPAADGPTVFPTAQTDDAGKFTLTSYQAGDGAVPGEYKVTATRYEIPALKNGRKPIAEGDTPSAVNVLPAKYASPASTPLQVAVKPGSNDPITITIDR